MAVEQKETHDLKLTLRYSDGVLGDNIIVTIPNPNPINTQQDAEKSVNDWYDTADLIGGITQSDDGNDYPYQGLFGAYTVVKLTNTFVKDGVNMLDD